MFGFYLLSRAFLTCAYTFAQYCIEKADKEIFLMMQAGLTCCLPHRLDDMPLGSISTLGGILTGAQLFYSLSLSQSGVWRFMHRHVHLLSLCASLCLRRPLLTLLHISDTHSPSIVLIFFSLLIESSESDAIKVHNLQRNLFSRQNTNQYQYILHIGLWC